MVIEVRLLHVLASWKKASLHSHVVPEAEEVFFLHSVLVVEQMSLALSHVLPENELFVVLLYP